MSGGSIRTQGPLGYRIALQFDQPSTRGSGSPGGTVAGVRDADFGLCLLVSAIAFVGKAWVWAFYRLVTERRGPWVSPLDEQRSVSDDSQQERRDQFLKNLMKKLKIQN